MESLRLLLSENLGMGVTRTIIISPCENSESEFVAKPDIVSPSKIYECDKCSKIFTSPSNQKKHFDKYQFDSCLSKHLNNNPEYLH